MLANLESAIQERVKALPPEKQQQVLDFVKGLTGADGRKTIWEKVDELLQDVPPEALDELPEDASENFDHYLYSAPKKWRRSS
jgi:hypothetical protein